MSSIQQRPGRKAQLLKGRFQRLPRGDLRELRAAGRRREAVGAGICRTKVGARWPSIYIKLHNRQNGDNFANSWLQFCPTESSASVQPEKLVMYTSARVMNTGIRECGHVHSRISGNPSIWVGEKT